MVTFNELETKFKAGEISLEEYISTPTQLESFKIMDGPKHGRRAAKKQAALITSLATESVQETRQEFEEPKMAEETRNAMAGQLSTAETALQYILAGNAYFTLRSKKTGTRYTYRVNRPKDNVPDSSWPARDRARWANQQNNKPERLFVSLLTGPENTTDYNYLGMIQDNVFRLTKASRMGMDSAPVKAFSWAFTKLVQRELPDQLEIWHDGRCGRCGRKLTVPESVAAGIGPECASKMESF